MENPHKQTIKMDDVVPFGMYKGMTLAQKNNKPTRKRPVSLGRMKVD